MDGAHTARAVPLNLNIAINPERKKCPNASTMIVATFLAPRRWGLPPLTVRDATANNLALALDFNHPRGGRPPPFAVAPQLVGAPCLPPLPTSHEIGLSALAALARGFGWKIPP